MNSVDIVRAGERFSQRLIPSAYRLPFVFKYRQLLGTLDPLILRLPGLAKGSGRALDIGANDGMFTVALSKLAGIVDAFEPQLDLVARLRRYAERKHSNVSIHHCGLSDSCGQMTLHIPVARRPRGKSHLAHGYATLASDTLAAFDDVIDCEVPVKRLDDFMFRDVCFMKIDVEGHEARVIAGAIETIRFCRPTLLVEIEERHLVGTGITVAEIIRMVESLGYSGFYLHGDQMVASSTFDARLHQEPYLNDVMAAVAAGLYVNNFVFIPNT